MADSRKYVTSGFEEEAVEMARQAVSLLKEAAAKADSVERDWEKLMQQVKGLRAKIGVLEDDGAAEFAPSEFNELRDIRDVLIECVNERDVDRLRSLLDRGMILTEKMSLMSPGRSRDREQVISSLAQVRQVIMRARKMGARECAPELLQEAYDYLDQAEAYARHAQWDEVRDCLASAESKALEAESIAVKALEEKEQLIVRLRETVGAASTALEDAMIHPFAREVMQDVVRARSVMEEAKACFESEEYERGIGLAENLARTIKDETIVKADEAKEIWNELVHRAGNVSARIPTIDLPLALKTSAEKIDSLSKSEKDLVDALCERDRDKLAASVSICERLTREILDDIAARQDGIRRAEDAISETDGLLVSAASAGVDGIVAQTYEEALRSLEDARGSLARGDADAALHSAQVAQSRLQAEVIERQEAARAKWQDLVPRSTELIRRVDAVCSLDAMYYCPEFVQNLHDLAAGMLSKLMARDSERVEADITLLEQAIEAIGPAIVSAKSERFSELSEQLAKVEDNVQGAVQRCAGNYAPDMLEDAYLDLNRIKEQVAAGPEAMTAAVENNLRRDIAVAQTKVWQVEYLRERFEREREETLNHLRMKMDSASEAIDACAKFDFIGEDSPLVQKARASLAGADNSLIEGEIDESFDMVRQSEAIAEEIKSEAEEKDRQWRELAEKLMAETAPHRILISDTTLEKAAADEYGELCELDAQTQSAINCKNIDTLNQHAEKLGRLCVVIRERVEAARNESRARIEQSIREAAREIRVAQVLKAEGLCPDVMNAARAYLDIAKKYLEGGDFSRADSAVRDAIAKSCDASILAQASLERAGNLALDYMQIAAARIEQQQPEAAYEALRQGLSLAELARTQRKDVRKDGS